MFVHTPTISHNRGVFLWLQLSLKTASMMCDMYDRTILPIYIFDDVQRCLNPSSLYFDEFQAGPYKALLQSRPVRCEKSTGMG